MNKDLIKNEVKKINFDNVEVISDENIKSQLLQKDKIIFGDDKLDITEEILELFNDKHKKIKFPIKFRKFKQFY